MPQRRVRRADDDETSSPRRRRRGEWDGALPAAAALATFVFLIVATSRLRDDAATTTGPSRRAFGVELRTPLEHSVARFLEGVGAATAPFRAGGLGAAPALDALALEAHALGRRAKVRGWEGDEGYLPVWDRGARRPSGILALRRRSAETGRGAAAAATRIVRGVDGAAAATRIVHGDESRRRRGRDADSP